MKQNYLLTVFALFIILMLTGCSSNNVNNKADLDVSNDNKVYLSTIFNEEIKFNMTSNDFELINKNNVKNNFDTKNSSNKKIYDCIENIFNKQCNVEYTFSDNELTEVDYNIAVEKNNVSEIVKKIKEKAINIYNLTEKDFDENSIDNTFRFNSYREDSIGILGEIKLEEKNIILSLNLINPNYK